MTQLGRLRCKSRGPQQGTKPHGCGGELAGVWMIAQTAWLDREFAFNQPIGVFPPLLERLRGTPARAKELVAGLSENILATRVNDKWSVKEHLGHVSDLQPLDDRRLSEFLNGVEVLSAADTENRATEMANHRSIPIAKIIQRLTLGREELIFRLEALTEDEVGRVALHPRLQKPMRLLDWVYFLAEHDDHHLARARSVIGEIYSQRFLKEAY
jgi:hypothetical protein